MTNSYCIELQESSSEDCSELLFIGVNEAAKQAKGMRPMQTFSLAVKDSKDQIVGGANGVVYYGCLYVDMLWIDKAARHLGLGSKLMHKAEQIGRQNQATFATVNTMDWEALNFYQKLGYDVEFIREGYEKDSKMFMLRKSL
jgi:GNAT superfamily N-acetyltransferase